jgi:anti-sigma B factor antagonist
MTRDGSIWLRAEEPRAVEAAGTVYAADDATGGSDADAVSFSISQQELEGATRLLSVRGELDLSTAPRLKWALAEALDADASAIVVDLSLVTFIDSTALGVLVGVQRSLSVGARLAIVCAHEHVLKILELTGLDGTFEIFQTLDGALAHARGSTAAAG